MNYKLRYSGRSKRIRIEVVPGEVRVVAPLGTKTLMIDLFVNSKKAWVKKKLDNFEQVQSSFARDKGKILLFGELLSHKDVVSLAENDGINLDAWLDAELLVLLKNLLTKYPGLTPLRIRLGSARTRWGSCNNKGVVMMNRKLVHAPPSVIEYVLVHELVHLKERNHSQLFWSEVGSILGDYRSQKRWLKEQGAFL